MSPSTEHPTQPPFIVIEGLDGAGTTTQSALLVERLQARGRDALLTREPSDGPIGALIRQMISMRVVAPNNQAINRQSLALLFAADRLDHLQATVEPALARGCTVVSDRYYHSSFAYQGDPDPDAPDTADLDLTWVQSLNSRARTPDLTVFLEAPVELCLERLQGRKSRDIFETREQLTRLEHRYAQVMRTLQAKHHPILRLDAALPRKALSDHILDHVDALKSPRS